VAPPASRTEVAINPGSHTVGAVLFRNPGTALVQGVLSADVSWIALNTAFISIPGGQTQTVEFTIDQNALAATGAVAGSAVGNIIVNYIRSQAGKTDTADAEPPTARASAPVSATTTAPVTGTALPPFALGEFAHIVPIVTGADSKVDITLGGKLPSASITSGQIFLLAPDAAQGLRISIPTFGATPLLFANIARTMFQQANPSGSFQIRSGAGDALLPAATLHGLRGGSPVSAALPVFRSDRAAGSEDTIVLPAMKKDANTATDIYLQETSGAAVSAAVEFRNDTGVQIGTATRPLTAFGVAELTDAVPAGATQMVVRLTGTGRAIAYGISRHTSGNRMVIAEWRRMYGVSAEEPLVVPIVSKGSGVSSDRRYDLHISNLDSAGTATVTADYYRRGGRTRGARKGVPGPPAPQSRNWTVAAGSARSIRNLAAEFGESNLDGHVIIRSSGGRISSVVETVDGASGGEVPALVIPLMPSVIARARGEVSPFLFDDAPRDDVSRPGLLHTDLGLIETAGSSARVRVSLTYAATGAAAVATPSREFALGPHESISVTDVVGTLLGPNRAELGELRGVRLQTQVIDGNGRVLSYLVQRDNVTGHWLVRPPAP
jgi:hypothetical protein